MEDEEEIIYMALSNSLIDYNNLLELSQDAPNEDLEMVRYIIKRHEELLDKYAIKIREADLPKTIKRPNFNG